MASIILRWKKFGTTKTLLRVGHPGKLSNWVVGFGQGRALVRVVTKNRMVTLTELQSSSVEMGRTFQKTTISAEMVVQSGLYGSVARRKLLLSKRHNTDRLEFAKRHLKDSQIMRKNILWSDKCFSGAGTGRLVRIRGKSTVRSLVKTCSRVLRTSGRGEGSPVNRTTTLSTQPREHEWLWDKSLNLLERPSQSTDLNPISGETSKYLCSDAPHST